MLALRHLAIVAAALTGAAGCDGSIQCTSDDECPSESDESDDVICNTVLGVCETAPICGGAAFCIVVRAEDEASRVALHVVELPDELCSDADCTPENCSVDWGVPGTQDDPVFSQPAAGEQRITAPRPLQGNYRVSLHVVEAQGPLAVNIVIQNADRQTTQLERILEVTELWDIGVVAGATGNLCSRADAVVTAAWECGVPADFACAALSP